jgi:hypothetical protein
MQKVYFYTIDVSNKYSQTWLLKRGNKAFLDRDFLADAFIDSVFHV